MSNPLPEQAGNTGPAAGDDEISLLDLLQTIAANLKLLVLAPLAVGLAVLGISFATPPPVFFTASTTFLPPQQQQGAAVAMLARLGHLEGLAGAVAGVASPAEMYVAFLRSRTVADRLIERFDLTTRYQTRTARVKGTRWALQYHTRVVAGRDGLIRIEVDDLDPVFAATLANAYLEELGLLLNRLAVTEAQQRRVFFGQKMQDTKMALIRAEQALAATGIGPELLRTQPQVAVAAAAQLQAQIAAQEVQLANMRGFLGETDPRFRQALTELAALRSQLRRLEGPAATAAAAPAGVRQDVQQTEYIARYREFKFQETLFEIFAQQYGSARVDEAREGAVMQVLDVAVPPDHQRSQPQRAPLMAVLATLATGFVLLLFVFVRQALRSASANPETSAKLAEIRRSLGLRA